MNGKDLVTALFLVALSGTAGLCTIFTQLLLSPGQVVAVDSKVMLLAETIFFFLAGLLTIGIYVVYLRLGGRHGTDKSSNSSKGKRQRSK